MKTAVINRRHQGHRSALVRAFLASGWNVAYSGTSRETIEKSFELLQGENSLKTAMPPSRARSSSEADLVSPGRGVSTFGSVDIWVNKRRTTSDQTPSMSFRQMHSPV